MTDGAFSYHRRFDTQGSDAENPKSYDLLPVKRSILAYAFRLSLRMRS